MIKYVNANSEPDFESLNAKNLEYLERIMNAVGDTLDYFHYHNKNLTKAQDYKLDDLEEVFRAINREAQADAMKMAFRG